MDTFGPAQLDPASIAITSPADGAWVKPGFSVRAELTSQLSATTGVLAVDGTTAQTIRQGDELLFSSPPSIKGGDHTVSVTTTDAADRTLSAEITVHVTDRCDGGRSCTTGFACLGGLCLPNASTPGGLGATCTVDGDCITGRCGHDGTDALCTDYCDAGDSCPSGYECVPAGAQSVCWPGSSSGGCSTANSEHSPLLVLFGLGMLGLIIRRRR
jgi:MYXO-CTERM domain-containing protein